MRSARAGPPWREIAFMPKSNKKVAPRKAAKKLRAPKSSKSAKKTRPVAKKAQTKPAPKTGREKPTPSRGAKTQATILGTNHKQRRLDPFTRAQKEKLLQLRDAMVDSMAGVAQDTLRSRAEGSEASAFGMHQADAGSDAYDRDFALSLLSQEQDALYEIDQALKRIELGTYGICEMSGKPAAPGPTDSARPA